MVFKIKTDLSKEIDGFIFKIGTCNKSETKNINDNYHCSNCDSLLFSSYYINTITSKFLSFTMPEILDNIEIMEFQTSIKILCRRCNTHIGYLLLNGPDPHRTNYYIDVDKLKKVKKKKE